MLRDSLIYWPWYNRSPEGLRKTPADFSAESLHIWTLEVMKQRTSYHQVIHAVIDGDTHETLRSLEIPVVIFADPAGKFRGYEDALQRLRPDALMLTFSSGDYAHAEIIGNLT